MRVEWMSGGGEISPFSTFIYLQQLASGNVQGGDAHTHSHSCSWQTLQSTFSWALCVVTRSLPRGQHAQPRWWRLQDQGVLREELCRSNSGESSHRGITAGPARVNLLGYHRETCSLGAHWILAPPSSDSCKAERLADSLLQPPCGWRSWQMQAGQWNRSSRGFSERSF